MTSQYAVMTEYMDAIDGMSIEQVESLAKDKSSNVYRFVRLLRRYTRAYKAAANYGFIGVGCITFAEARLDIFRKRTGL